MAPTKINIGNLTARYYVCNGWSLDILDKYLIIGSFVAKDFDDHMGSIPYWILSVGSRIDVDKLLEDYPDVEIIPYWPIEEKKSKKEILESKNWEIGTYGRINS